MSTRIPFAQVQTDGNISVGAPPQFSLAAGAENAGGALAAVGSVLGKVSDIGERIVDARNSVKISDALTDASSKLSDYRDELNRDPDTASREAKFAAKLNEVKQSALSNLDGGHATDQFSIRYNQLFRPMQLQVKQQARDEDIQNFKVGLVDNLDRLSTSAVFAKTPEERMAVQEEANKSIVDAVATGRIGAAQAQTYKKGFLGNVDGALASEMVRANPSAAIQALGDPAQFPNLDAARRVALRSQATQRAESLGVQARAELRADVAEFMGDLRAGAVGGNMPSEQEKNALLKRAGGSAEGVRLQKAWDFFGQVNDQAQSKSIPELQSTVAEINRGPIAKPGTANRDAAVADLKLTPQETQLYDRHLGNVAGPGGVTNPDGSRSTLYQTTTEQDGRFYNVPTVWDGKVLPPREAIDRAAKQGLDSFPSYPTQQEAEARYTAMHGYMDKDVQRTPPSAEDLHRSRVLATALAQKVKARDQDPAAYVLKSYPTIGEQMSLADQQASSGDAMVQAQSEDTRRAAWAAVIAAQQREGVPEGRIALLPKQKAEDIKAQLLTSEGQKRVDQVVQLRQQFGEQWPRVVNQLWEGKPAPPDVQVISALPPGANLPAVTIAEANKVTPEIAHKELGSDRVRGLEDQVRQQLAGMATTMAQAPQGPAFINSYQTMAEKVAQLYAIRGEGNDKTAAQRAANDVFYNHFATLDTLRIPKVQGVPVADPGDIRTTQAAILKVLPDLDLALPAGGQFEGMTDRQRRDMLVSTARSSGFWMATPDDKGMVLMTGQIPVFFADGHPVVVPFDSVNGAARAEAARVADAKRRQLAGLGEMQGLGGMPSVGGEDDADHNTVEQLPPWMQRAIGKVRRLPPDPGLEQGIVPP